MPKNISRSENAMANLSLPVNQFIDIRNIIKNHMARKLVLIRKRGQLLSAKPIPPIAEPTNCTGIAK